jgi:hypothetical protein
MKDVVALAKTCSRCNEEKPRFEFHRDTRKADGLSPWCKLCKNTHRLDSIKAKLKDPTSTESIRKKIYAQVAGALANGTLVKPKACPVCEVEVDPTELQGHHHDYSKPLDVEWICRQCHIKQHRAEREEALPLCPYCQTKRIAALGLATCGDPDCTVVARKLGGHAGASLNTEARSLKRLATADHMLELMAQRNLTQSQLAKHLNVSTSYVSQALKRAAQIREERAATTPATPVHTD